MSIVVSLILLLLVFLVYRQELKRRDNILLFVLRLVVIGLLVFIIIGQAVKFRWQSRPSRVIFLVDRSASMDAVADDSTVNQALATLVNKFQGVKPEVWVFGDTFLKGAEAKPGRERTRLARALAEAGKSMPGAIVVLSDGQDNSESDPITAAGSVKVPIYTVGFRITGQRNLSIKDVTAPVTVYQGDTVTVKVVVASGGFNPGERAVVRLADRSREIPLTSDLNEQEVVFPINFTEPGRKVIQVVAESVVGELTYVDNQRAISIDVLPSRIKTIYITNRPGFPTRFILRALEKDSRVALVRAVAFTGGLDFAGKFISEADVLILDNVAENRGDDAFWRAVKQKVEAGRGVFVIAGDNFKPGGYLSDLLPIKEPKLVSGSFSPYVNQTGENPLGVLADEIDFDALPPFNGMWQGVAVSSRISVWLRAQENDEPLLLAGRAGKGRVVYLAGVGLWRWGFLPGQQWRETPLERLLSGIIRYLNEPDTVRFVLETESGEFLAGQPVRLNLRARTPEGEPWDGLDVRLKLNDTAGKFFSLPMRGKGLGRYEVEVTGLAPGGYEVVADVFWNEMLMGSVKGEVSVSEQSAELVRLGLNSALLRRIAELSGGRFFYAESIEYIHNQELRLGFYQHQFSLQPRRLPWCYALLAVIFGVELVLRRRRGFI